MESVGGRFAPKIYAHSRLELSDPFAKDIQKAYDELLDPARREGIPIETDAQKVALELIESREQLRTPNFHKEIDEGRYPSRSAVLDPALEAQWGGFIQEIATGSQITRLGRGRNRCCRRSRDRDVRARKKLPKGRERG